MKKSVLIVLIVAFTLGSGIINQAIAQVDLTSPNIQITAKDKIRICVTPHASLAGKYIVRPRCDNVNLVLRCPPGGDEVKPIQVVGRAVAIACPPVNPCDPESEDPQCRDDHIDIVKVPEDAFNIRPLCVECPIADYFDISDQQLGIVKGKGEGITVACSIEGSYQTFGFKDRHPTLSSDLVAGQDDCVQNGRIPLTPTAQTIPSRFLCLNKPVGMRPDKLPELTDCAPTVIGPPVTLGPPSKGVFQGSDNDGFYNLTESSGFALAYSMSLSGGSYPAKSDTNIPACASSNDPDRVFCAWYNTQDLFAILHPLDPSESKFADMNSITDLKDFFFPISEPKASGGLEITVHPLKQPQPDPPYPRTVRDGQKAIRVIEDDASLILPIKKSTPIVLGESGIGTPNTAGEIIIYTRRIKQYICDLCGGTPDLEGNCSGGNFGGNNCIGYANDPAQGGTLIGEALLKGYAKYVNVHEIGHSLNRVLPANPSYGYHHTPDNYAHIMIPSVTYTKKGSKVKFYLPYIYDTSCQDNKALK